MSDIAPRPEDLMGLSDGEYDTILEILGRAPNFTELGIFSVMWSEHCSYKHTKELLGKLPTEGEHVLEGPGENAGVISVDDEWAIVVKIESHNHPSAVAPYEVVWTGEGGVGVHIPMAWDGRVEAWKVRCVKDKLVKRLRERLHKVEFFPKQDAIGPDKYGSLTRLPLWGKSTLVDIEDDFTPIDPIEALEDTDGR